MKLKNFDLRSENQIIQKIENEVTETTFFGKSETTHSEGYLL